MPDTKEGREKQAANQERRQREREIAEEQARADEVEPPEEEAWMEEGESRPEGTTCHIRGCNEPATFVVSERYREETGQGTVVAEAVFCAEHAAQEGPTNLEADFEEYRFRVEPLSSEHRE